jgi:hypothetical protein
MRIEWVERVQVLTAMKIHVVFFWVVTQRDDAVGQQRYSEP